ncbi:acid protease [Parathielavia appendiculata]|uniref:Acid protease n=1 Tax=Parathielavia appendiculata TaxID=2587402 RepID=A0AAN6U187_9PEZI|nr:acid protease [Parathielavia appendiculata]
MLFWISLQLGLAWGGSPAWNQSCLGSRTSALAPFQLDGLTRRNGHEPPINIDLLAWKRGIVSLQWYGDITVGTPPLVFDTSASLMLIAHKNCSTCGDHQQYDHEASSTRSGLSRYRREILFGNQGGGTTGSDEPQGANCTSGQLLGAEFNFSFISDRKGHDGVLTLGGTDRRNTFRTLKKIPINWPLSSSRLRWVVDVRGARIDGFTLTNSTDAVTLVDRGGATVITPDTNTTRQLYGRIAPCDVLDRVVRDLTSTVGSAEQNVDVGQQKVINVGVYSGNVTVGEYAGKPDISQGVFTNPEVTAREPINRRPSWIFGNPWLWSYYTVRKSVDQAMGFATPSHHRDCD